MDSIFDNILIRLDAPLYDPQLISDCCLDFHPSPTAYHRSHWRLNLSGRIWMAKCSRISYQWIHDFLHKAVLHGWLLLETISSD